MDALTPNSLPRTPNIECAILPRSLTPCRRFRVTLSQNRVSLGCFRDWLSSKRRSEWECGECGGGAAVTAAGTTPTPNPLKSSNCTLLAVGHALKELTPALTIRLLWLEETRHHRIVICFRRSTMPSFFQLEAT